MLIKGIHHISMKCAAKADFDRAKDFYTGILGLSICREQLDLFSQRAGAERHPDGIWRHRADHHILWFHKDFISQVGILRRAVVILDDDDKMMELVNPEILEESGEQRGPEGCLSAICPPPGGAGRKRRNPGSP